MLTAKDLEKYHQAAERILNAMDNSPVPISWHEMDRMASECGTAYHTRKCGNRTTAPGPDSRRTRTCDTRVYRYADAGTRIQKVTAWNRWKTREKVNPSPL